MKLKKYLEFIQESIKEDIEDTADDMLSRNSDYKDILVKGEEDMDIFEDLTMFNKSEKKN